MDNATGCRRHRSPAFRLRNGVTVWVIDPPITYDVEIIGKLRLSGGGGGDLNPRGRFITVYTLSRRAPSTARPPPPRRARLAGRARPHISRRTPAAQPRARSGWRQRLAGRPTIPPPRADVLLGPSPRPRSPTSAALPGRAHPGAGACGRSDEDLFRQTIRHRERVRLLARDADGLILAGPACLGPRPCGAARASTSRPLPRTWIAATTLSSSTPKRSS